MKNSIKIAMCSVMTALSVALLFLGGIMFAFGYIMPIVTSAFMIILKKTLSSSSAAITYVSTSILSMILVPDKECVLMYILFFGYYPLIYHALEKVRIKPVRCFIKLVVFNASQLLVQLMLVYIFHIPFLDEGEGKVFNVLFAILMNVLFAVYDFAIKAFWRIYVEKIEKRIKKYFK